MRAEPRSRGQAQGHVRKAGRRSAGRPVESTRGLRQHAARLDSACDIPPVGLQFAIAADTRSPLVVLFGPTASGKSEILASVFDNRFEVINADSMQVYRHLDIGTAKPDAHLREKIPHHLIDVADPSQQFNAGEFVSSAESLADQIRVRGRIPVICGGTAFYVTSFLYGLPESPVADRSTRARLKEVARTEGRAALARMLRERDPGAADRIHEGDTYRITRALEVLEATGESIFSFRWPRTVRPDFRFLLLGLRRAREDLYRRIDQRVERMFSEGLLGEIKGLIAMGYRPSDPGLRGIGYREVLATRLGCLTVGGARELIKRNTRRYAKRQITFFRSVAGVRWFDPADVPLMRAAVDEFLLP